MQNWNTRDFQKLLRRNGFDHLRTSGDHLIYGKDEKRVVITIGETNGCIARKIIKQYELA